MSEITRLIQAVGRGEGKTSELLPLIYEELRQLARLHMAQERPGHTLQATALIHEAYLRLTADAGGTWEGRGHFFAAAAEAMRRILIEHARRSKALKNGGSRSRVEWMEDFPAIDAPGANVDDILTVNEALEDFARVDAEKAELVKLLYFAGFSLDEAAQIRGIGRTTAYRHWMFAKAWLYDRIHDPAAARRGDGLPPEAPDTNP